ncbi:MAG: hypothetical protein IT577_03665 [Verrucomicrobiae bacterium]|nr:hypothetical protein [Verrucomicrobiae bacterium]
MRHRSSFPSARWLLMGPGALFGVMGLLGAGEVRMEPVAGEELAVLRAVVSRICDASCEVREKTLTGHRVDQAMLRMWGPDVPPDGATDDLNAKSGAGRMIPGNALDGVPRKPRFSPDGPGMCCELSRPGIDAEGKWAMVLVKLIELHPRDIISEGKCVLLRRKEGAWKVERIVQAWPAMLGE